MDFQTTIKLLSQYAREMADMEPQIMQTLGKFLSGRNRSSGGAVHLLQAFNKAVFGHKETTPYAGSFYDELETEINNPNLVTILRTLQRESYTINEMAGTDIERDGFYRRYYFPFVLPVCLRVNAPLDPDPYRIPRDDIERIRTHVEDYFMDYSFSKPLVYDRLYPVSGFGLNGNAYRHSYLAASKVSSFQVQGNLERHLPFFHGEYDSSREEYNEGLKRDYRMIFGIASLRTFVWVDILDHLRAIQENPKNRIVRHVTGGIMGDLSPNGFSEHNSTRTVDFSRVTINRPFPAVGGYDHFMDSVYVEDAPTADFWELWENNGSAL